MYIVFCVCVVQFGLAIWRWNAAAQIHNIPDRPPGWWWKRWKTASSDDDADDIVEEWRFIKMNMCRSILVWPSGGERSKVPKEHIAPYTLHIIYTHLASHIIHRALQFIHDIDIHWTLLHSTGFSLYLGHNTIYIHKVKCTLHSPGAGFAFF